MVKKERELQCESRKTFSIAGKRRFEYNREMKQGRERGDKGCWRWGRGGIIESERKGSRSKEHKGTAAGKFSLPIFDPFAKSNE